MQVATNKTISFTLNLDDAAELKTLIGRGIAESRVTPSICTASLEVTAEFMLRNLDLFLK